MKTEQKQVAQCSFKPDLNKSKKSNLPDSPAYLGFNLDLFDHQEEMSRFDSLFMHSAKRG